MVRLVIHACHGLGVERSEVLNGLHFDGPLSDIRTRITTDCFEEVCKRALALSKEPALGLTIASCELSDQALQLVGHLVRSATSLREAHRDFERYGSLVAKIPVWTLHEAGDEARFEFHCPTGHPETERMAHEWIAALAYKHIRAFAPGPRLRPSRVDFVHTSPSHAKRYTHVFDCGISFGQPTNAIVFPRALLDLEQLCADSIVSSALREAADRLVSQVSASARYVDRVRALLCREPELVRAGIDHIARRMSLSTSTLRRTLALEGASPSDLLEEMRCRVACAALSRSDRSIKGIAVSLGYADARSFHRAFKRWTGTTPLSYRRSS